MFNAKLDMRLGQSRSVRMVMRNRFYPGDPCPECTYPLERHGRSILTLFLRRPFLKCPHCKLVLSRFPSGSTREAGDHRLHEDHRGPLLNH